MALLSEQAYGRRSFCWLRDARGSLDLFPRTMPIPLKRKARPEGFPEECRPFVTTFERAAPDELARQPRRRSVTWNGERLFMHYDWVGGKSGAIAFVRLQLFPRDGRIWIGALEVDPAYREQRIGSSIVSAIEEGAKLQGVQFIRLFSRLKSTGFWIRLGYAQESDPRYFRKSVCETESAER